MSESVAKLISGKVFLVPPSVSLLVHNLTVYCTATAKALSKNGPGSPRTCVCISQSI